MMRPITVVLPHFQNLGMFAEQQRVWADLDLALRSQVHVILVDDCSPKGFRPSRKSVTVDGLGSLRIYRLLEHKRWNWLACRNLGAKQATTDWLLLTDIDHVVPEATIRRLVDGPLDEAQAYRFRRVTATRCWPYDVADCPPYKPHNDTWLVTKALFFHERVFGYDERLSGCYGTSGEFRDRLVAQAKATVILDEVIVRYPREIIADASTSPLVYTRKGDPLNDGDLENRKFQRALIKNWKPLHGLIKHETVYDSEVLTEVAAS